MSKLRKTGYIRVFILWMLLIILIVGAAGFVYARFLEERIHVGSLLNGSDSAYKHITPRAQDSDPITFLLLGSDKRWSIKEDPGRSDTIMVLRINPQKKIAYLISFPRDSRVDIPGHGKKKINAAYQYGGPDLMIQTIHQLTGLEINHFAVVDFDGFKEIVNALGGIDINVEKDIKDHFQGRDIFIPAGRQHLEGQTALDYVRVRHVDDDFGRMGRQQQFLKGIMDKVLSLGGVLRIPQLANIASNNITTDNGLSLGEMASYANMVRSVGRSNLHMLTLPGTCEMIGDGSYVVLDQGKMAWILDRINNDLPPELTAEEKQIQNITVDVQNGTGTSGMAKKMADKLSANGFKVGQVGNAENFNYYNTRIIAPGEMVDLAKTVQTQLGFGRVVMQTATEGSFVPNITVIVGRDFSKYQVSGASGSGGSSGSGTASQ